MSKLTRKHWVDLVAALLVFGLALVPMPSRAATPLPMRISLVNLPGDILVDGGHTKKPY